MFPANTRILVVDDMMTMRKLVIKVCKELGYTDIVEAADGKLAWEALQAAVPPIGLIISDWNMPNMTGLEFLGAVRGNPKFHHVPFLMVTAEAEQGQVIQALAAGVSNYVVKPFTPESLTEKLMAIYSRIKKAK